MNESISVMTDAGELVATPFAGGISVDINLPDGTATRIHVSGGIAWYPDDGTEMMELIKCADYAMYGIKKSEKGRFGVFDRAQYERAEKKIKDRETRQNG